jgi:hypothetical protein
MDRTNVTGARRDGEGNRGWDSLPVIEPIDKRPQKSAKGAEPKPEFLRLLRFFAALPLRGSRARLEPL